jgi:hypothetical protein
MSDFYMKNLTLTCVLLFSLFVLVMDSSCNKEHVIKMTNTDTTKKANVDSTAYYISGIWILNKTEAPKDTSTWIVISDAGSLDYDTLTLGADSTVTNADNNNVTATGTWRLSANHALITLTYPKRTETDTISVVNAKMLQLIRPWQVVVYNTLYNYSRDTYLRK